VAEPYNDPKIRINRTVVCHVIEIVLKFCQRRGTWHHWSLQIPWQYFGRIIHLIYSDVHDK